MRPFAFFYGSAMFFPACLTATGRLANVNFITSFTGVPIYGFLFLRISFSRIFVAKNVSKLGARLEAGVDTSFSESTFYPI